MSTIVILMPALAKKAQTIATKSGCHVVPRRVSNPTLVAHGLAASAAWHLVTQGPPKRPIADLYGMKQPLAARVARLFATTMGEPVILYDNEGAPDGTPLKQHRKVHVEVMGNPKRRNDDTWRDVQAVIDKMPLGSALKDAEIQAKATASLQSWLTSHLRHNRTVSRDEIRHAWMSALLQAAKKGNPSRSKTARTQRGSRKQTRLVRGRRAAKAGARGAYYRAASKARDRRRMDQSAASDRRHWLEMTSRRYPVRQNPHRRMVYHADTARIFGKPWEILSLNEVTAVLKDIGEISDAEMGGDDGRAAVELRRRIGGAANIKSYARSLVAGGRHLNPRRDRTTRQLSRAARTFRSWQDRGPIAIRTKKLRAPAPLRDAAAELGQLVAVTYRSDKYTGKTTDYEHEFSKPLPSLVTDPDAKGLHIVGGRYAITRDGIKH